MNRFALRLFGEACVLLALVVGGASCQPTPPARSRADDVLSRATEWLWSQQAEDGGWHSSQYAYLRSGQALTPFVLHALLEAESPAVDRSRATQIEQALAFLRSRIDEVGVLGSHDPDLSEYPNYATAFALRCFLKAGSLEVVPDENRSAEEDRALVGRMRRALVQDQYRDANGFPAAHWAHGGWGMGGHRAPGSPGHMDLSYTRHVLQALRESGSVEPEVSARVERFLWLVQKHPDETRAQPGPPSAGATKPRYDGGFYFSPIMLTANKGGVDTEHGGYRSYATATCDGLIALLEAGIPLDDERVHSARRWLQKNSALDPPPGIPVDDPSGWAGQVRFYHFAVRAEAYDAVKFEGGWRAELRQILRREQRDDGSFVNAGRSLMKEDDPLLATTLAVIALTRCRTEDG